MLYNNTNMLSRRGKVGRVFCDYKQQLINLLSKKFSLFYFENEFNRLLL